MGLLHTVNKSPFESNTFDTCLGYALDGSTVLLIEDGVYAATIGTRASEKIQQKIQSNNDVSFAVLGPDLQARGLENKLADGIKVVDYEGFVNLVAEHDSVQSWL
ncbi:MAG: sulfurtransferase complex subunit TusB [Gammaproteobacteria bacterium]|nr:sulfurtransferase complex subunit TusB [Gammaproteobacteria bacterium]